jgi:hypothetical protein
MLGSWRCVYADDNRAKAEEFARENVRHGGAVVQKEVRDGDGVEVVWQKKVGG